MKPFFRASILIAAAALAVGAVACGGDDDDEETATSTPAGSSGEPVASDVCELVPASVVEEVMGSPVTTAPLGVDDELPGTGCTYTGSGVLLSISVTPDGAAFYDANKSVPAPADITERDDLGDQAFVYLDTEVQAVKGDTLVQVQFPSGVGAGEQGVELARRTIDALP